jgi:hypothetical protein
MNWHSVIGALSTVALFAPVFIILAFRLIKYKPFIPLFIYFAMGFIYNLMTEDVLRVPRSFERTYGIINNLLDVPVMFSFLITMASSTAQKLRMKMLLAIFIVFEIVILFITGLSVLAITIVMGPGLLLVFGYALYFFAYTVKKSFIHNKYIAKAMIASALCFAYGCFIIIYLMHYVAAIPDVPNIFLIYFIVTILYCSLLSAGLVLESKRKRKLEELLVTRKELFSFFAEEKKPATSGKVTGQFKLN